MDVQINLLPRLLREDRARKRVVRLWGAACAICLVLALVAFGVGRHNTKVIDQSEIESRLSSTIRQSDQLVMQISQSREAIASTRRELASVQQVVDQPDLQLLLRLVGERIGDEAMLTSCRMGLAREPSIRSAAGTHASDLSQPWLVIGGVAEDHQAVPAIVLRFEELGLFTRVVLNETWSETYDGHRLVGFRIACSLPREGD